MSFSSECLISVSKSYIGVLFLSFNKDKNKLEHNMLFARLQ